jgi:uncharacterized protein YacL
MIGIVVGLLLAVLTVFVLRYIGVPDIVAIVLAVLVFLLCAFGSAGL